MNLKELHHFSLGELFLCLEADCGRVGNSNSYCPACNSTALLPLTKLIVQMAAPKEMM